MLANSPPPRYTAPSFTTTTSPMPIQRLSATHHAIADWLIANPGKNQMERCATKFGYTRAWLSTLIHTDAFQALLRSKQEDVFHEVVVPLKEKIAGVAHAGLDRLGEHLDKADFKETADVTKDMLAALGYGPKAVPAGGVNQNNYYFGPDALEAARERNRSRFNSGDSNAIEGTALPDNSQDQTPTIELSEGQPHGDLRGDAREGSSEGSDG